MNIDGTEQRRAFAVWLRTGRLPTVSDEGIEIKFNPWHDPDDGKFTHAGAGRYFGSNGARSAGRPARGGRNVTSADRRAEPSVTSGDAAVRKAGRTANQRDKPRNTAVEQQSTGRLGKFAEFADGFGEGVYDVGKETVTGLYDVFATNPGTTMRNAARGIAKTIDAAVAEDTPAYVQIRQAKDAVANASAHDLGYATGQVAGNVALTAAPGAAATKILAVRRVAIARPREVFHPPNIKWAKENLGKDSPAKPIMIPRQAHGPARLRR